MNFSDTNLLALYPAEDSGFPNRFFPIRPYFKSLTLLNYADTCHSEGIGGAQNRIAGLVREKKIGLVLVCPFASDYQLSPEFYAGLRQLVPVVFWFSDDPLYFESYCRYYAQAGDAVITTEPAAAAAYRWLEIPALICQDLTATNKYHPVKTEKDIDVCFIGDMRKPGRAEYVRFLSDNGIKTEVFGQGAPNGYLPSEKVPEYFCRSRINLNFSGVGAPDWKNPDQPLLARIRQNTGRPREIALTGAFCLTEYSPAMDIMFKPGEEIDYFRNREELLEKVRFYLANPEKREALAAAAHARAVADHREDVYLPRMLEELSALLKERGRKKPWGDRLFLSGSFKSREVNSLTFSAFLMLWRGRFLPAAATFFRLFRRGPAAFLSGFPRGAARAVGNLSGKLQGGRQK